LNRPVIEFRRWNGALTDVLLDTGLFLRAAVDDLGVSELPVLFRRRIFDALLLERI
jgi:hypothetical protein